MNTSHWPVPICTRSDGRSLPHTEFVLTALMCDCAGIEWQLHCSHIRAVELITRQLHKEDQLSQWQSEPWEPHWFTNHLAVNAISTEPRGNPHWSPVLLSDPVPLKNCSIPVFGTSGEVKQKFLVIWEGLEPWFFLFHILFLPPPFTAATPQPYRAVWIMQRI